MSAASGPRLNPQSEGAVSTGTFSLAEDAFELAIRHCIAQSGLGCRVVVPRGLQGAARSQFVAATHKAGAIPAAIRVSRFELSSEAFRSEGKWADSLALSDAVDQLNQMHDAVFRLVVLNRFNDSHVYDVVARFRRSPVNPPRYPSVSFGKLDISSSLSSSLVHRYRSAGYFDRKLDEGFEAVLRGLRGARFDIRKQMDQAASSIATGAARLAGPNFPWALEAWRADLEYGPGGRDQRFSAPRRLLFAARLLVIAAPRMRLMPAMVRLHMFPGRAWNLTVRVFDSWLASDAALGVTSGSVLSWLGWVFYESASATGGFDAGITAAAPAVAITGTALFAALRWLRHRRVPRRG